MNEDPKPKDHFNSADPEDLAFLVRSGAAWNTSEQAAQRGVDAIINGTLPLPANAPQWVKDLVAK